MQPATVQEVRRQVGEGPPMRGSKSVTLDDGGAGEFGVLRVQRIHVSLQLVRILLQPHLGVPWRDQIGSRALEGLPFGGIVSLEALDQIALLVRRVEFGMRGCEQDNVGFGGAEFRRFLLHYRVGEKKDNRVEGDESDRNNWPASGLHVLVTDRNEHWQRSPVRRAVRLREGKAHIRLRK